MKTLKRQSNSLAQALIIAIMVLVVSSCEHKNREATIKAEVKGWVLNSQYSSISIITTKNSSVSEISNFTKFSGNIDGSGKLLITIELDSLETNIPIRNERIQEHLFQTKTFATADIHAQLKPEDLSIGVHNITFDVDLHGVSGILQAEFMVFEQYGNKVVTLHSPLIINAQTFGLENGINTLKNIAKLSSISTTVPINLILNFEKLK